MPRQTKRTGWQKDVLEFWRGGQTMPEALLRRRIAVVKRNLAARYGENRAIKQQATNYWSRIQEPSRSVSNDPQVTKAISGLLGLHKKLAKQKLFAPRVLAEAGGFLPGNFGATVVPPFDYAFTIPFPINGNTALAGSADKNTGQLNASAITDSQAPSRGGVYTEMGIYLRPPRPIFLSVSATPAISIEWWTNSLNPASTVASTGSALLGIWAQQGTPIGPSKSATAPSLTDWDEELTQQVRFDFGSNPHEPLSTNLAVDPSFSCLLLFATDNEVLGVGWPGSLAGSMTSVTVPSFTFDSIQVATPG